MSEELGKTFIAAQIVQGQVDKLDDAIVRHKANMVADPDFKDECIWPRECDHQA